MPVLEKIELTPKQETVLNEGGLVWIHASWEQFLDFEPETRFSTEYHDGHLVVSSPETYTHEWFVAHLAYLFSTVFPEQEFYILGSNLGLVPRGRIGLYLADLSILKGEPEFFENNDSMLTNPYLLVEIWPETTRQVEFSEKLMEYQKIPSLRVLVVVDPKTDSVTVHTRTERPKTWLTTLYDQPDEIILIDGRELPLADVFRGKPKSHPR